MNVFLKKTGNLKNVKDIEAHVKYIGFRSQEKDKVSLNKGFFDSNGNKASYRDFINRIKENKALRHPNSIKAHKLVFSLKDKDYNAYLRSGKDYKDLVRATLKEYEEKHGVKLDWIASIHEVDGKGKSNHPHVHVVIKGVSDRKDQDGRYQRIYFKKDDFKELRNIFDKEFQKDCQYNFWERLDIEKTLDDIGKSIESMGRSMSKTLSRSIENEVEKSQAEAERDKQKQIRRKVRNENDRGGR